MSYVLSRNRLKINLDSLLRMQVNCPFRDVVFETLVVETLRKQLWTEEVYKLSNVIDTGKGNT